jgi:cytochrome c-type biogenesis protein CcmE
LKRDVRFMKRWKFVAIGAGIILCMGYLVVSAIQATGVPYKHVRELAQLDPTTEKQQVKVTGQVKEGTMNYDPHAPRIDFRVKGPEGRSIAVVYEGVKPDAMVEGSRVILQGVFHPGEQRLRADSLLAKCPSRYKAKYDSSSDTSTSPKPQ